MAEISYLTEELKVESLYLLNYFMKSEQDESNEVIFYNLDNNNLTEFKLETIIDADNRCEITTYKEDK